jgi:hypothetical protein
MSLDDVSRLKQLIYLVILLVKKITAIKTINLIFLSLLFIAISCEKKSESDKIAIKKINFTDCTANTVKSTSSVSCLSIQSVDHNFLKIKHYNALFSCGSEDFDIQSEFNSDSITLKEIDLGPYTYCFCPHDVEFEIGPLENMIYRLKLIDPYKQDSIIMDFLYSDILNIDYCN